MTGIKNLIICDPYKKPSHYWQYNDTKNEWSKIPGRRPFEYMPGKATTLDDHTEVQENLVNKIRNLVDLWRDAGYPYITGITRELLNHWNDNSFRVYPYFFCQLEAIETLIWLIETPDTEKEDIVIPSDGGLFERLCSKMATGTGKTVVMAMLIAWQVTNKVAYPRDARFSKDVLVMAPGITVKSRLEVLVPSSDDNYYDTFDIVPDSLHDMLQHGNITIHNWHKLQPEEDKSKSVVKLGTESNEMLSRRILKHNNKDIIVINDEAHHAYRKSDSSVDKFERERNTIWIDGLDRIHNARNIIKCFDFSATPFIPTGKNISEEMIFNWIVSDFSLNDAIESGLTKTPAISVKDDTRDTWSKFYHIYKERAIQDNLKSSTKLDVPLPELVIVAYTMLGEHYTKIKKSWLKSNIPPVMISVCNNTNTAKRILHAFDTDRFKLDELSDPKYMLHIDSKSLQHAESKDTINANQDEDLRIKVNTVGKDGKPGEQIRNVIAVNMLSEGWDAHNVTHIMGLRAFSSQLLCEQVIGRGLRRMSYDIDPQTGLFRPEYVYVMGVPFTFIPHEIQEQSEQKNQKPPVKVFPDKTKKQYEISWPNIERINSIYSKRLKVNWNKIKPLELTSENTIISMKLACITDGKPHLDQLEESKLEEIAKEIREQTIIFTTAKSVFENIESENKKGKEIDWFDTRNNMYLFVQVVKLVEEFIARKKIYVPDILEDNLRKKMTIWFNMEKIVTYVCNAIKNDDRTTTHVILNPLKPTRSTSDMRVLPTIKSTVPTKKSHLNYAICDSGWEEIVSKELDRNTKIVSWFKNYHSGLLISYMDKDGIHRYIPDFIIKLKNNINLILEVKGQEKEKDVQKEKGLANWIKAVNDNGKYGIWKHDTLFDPPKITNMIEKYSQIHSSKQSLPESA